MANSKHEDDYEHEQECGYAKQLLLLVLIIDPQS
jgi:hypothetical protein